MEFRKITAIVRTFRLEKVEERLRQIGVRGISVSNVKGYGEHANFLARDWLCGTHARIRDFRSR